MCDRDDLFMARGDEIVSIPVVAIWPQLLSRHATCMPSRDCVIDAALAAEAEEK